ncbi:MAG: UDP-N-acetylmuramoyl-L-alanyl-D-glutamate--2,6-diaminopimelate ligase [Verrucomicrobiales bacterium]|nr:UDP-N-acetylmuramoyl-L-alanyl-D-glutamate--2,6-diaminopimelate ligase [Verrucomicrobiales bacterium]
MQLKELIEDLFVKSTSGTLAVDIEQIAYDSRQVTAGSLFVALRGEDVDGHQFIDQAVASGAVAVMAEDPPPPDAKVPWVQVKNSRVAMALAADVLFGAPSADLAVVGITGTNGKTTTAYLLHHLMKSVWHRSGLIGTTGVETGVQWLSASHTTPESVEIQSLLSQMRDEQCRGAVMEVSSHGLAQHRVDGVRYAVGVFTNLSQDHLDYHGNMESYFLAKKRLFDLMSTQRRSGLDGDQPVMVVNGDDSFGRRLVDIGFPKLEVLTYGMGASCDFRASNVRSTLDGTVFQLEMKGRSMLVRTPLIGRFNVYNTLAALAAAQGLNLNLREAVANLANAPQIPGRLESVSGRQTNFRVYVDYAHTPDAIEKALTTLRELKPERIITVFGCGGDRDRDKRPLMGRAVEQLSDVAIVTSDNPRTESAEDIIAQVVAGMGQRRYQVIEDRRKAIRAAIDMAGARDIVLIAGKGHEDYQEINGVRHDFDDRKMARNYIAATVEDRAAEIEAERLEEELAAQEADEAQRIEDDGRDVR